MKNLFVIYRKEFLDIFRDKKTIIFALLVPTVLIPIMMMGIGSLTQKLTKKEKQRTVTIAAPIEVQTAYRDMVFQWFLSSEFGGAMMTADSPLSRMLMEEDHGDELAKLPEGFTQDPVVFEEWIHNLARNTDEAPKILQEENVELEDIDPELIAIAQEFYRTAVRGLGLVDFVDVEIDPKQEIIPQVSELVSSQEVDAVLFFADYHHDKVVVFDQNLQITMVYDSTISSSGEARSRMSQVFSNVESELIEERLTREGLSEAILDPIDIQLEGNIATPSRQSLHVFGMILPYMVIVFSFLGGLIPALDLGAGEKERFTLETLLLTPASRLEIALGKYLVILTTSLIAAYLGVISMVMSFQFVLPNELRSMFEFQISSVQVISVALLAIPPAAAFAGLFLSLSIFARSVKEAQNTIAPFQFLLIFPALAPALPGIELNTTTALIPLVNVSLLAKDFLKGDINLYYYALTVGSCLALAALCLAYCIRQFHKESVLFRS